MKVKELLYDYVDGTTEVCLSDEIQETTFEEVREVREVYGEMEVINWWVNRVQDNTLSVIVKGEINVLSQSNR